MFAAVIDDTASVSVQIFLRQELFVQPGRNVLPGQDLVQRALAAGEPVHLQVTVGKGPLPEIEAEILTPGVKFSAQFPGALDDIAQPAVAAGEEGFDQRFGWIIPSEMDARPFQLLLQ